MSSMICTSSLCHLVTVGQQSVPVCAISYLPHLTFKGSIFKLTQRHITWRKSIYS